MADGGEGTLEALGGPNRSSTVTGPLGEPVEAGWRLERRRAVIEMARASGLGPGRRRRGQRPGGAPPPPAPASSSPTRSRAGPGTSWSAWAARPPPTAGSARCGPSTRRSGCGASSWWWPATCAPRFVDAAARVRSAEGGHARAGAAADRPARAAGRRLPARTTASTCADLDGSGAAGGLAGGLAAVGRPARVRASRSWPTRSSLFDRLEGADLVITGEGFLDAESFDGKVVGGVAALAAELGVPVLAVAGRCFDGVDERIESHLPRRALRRGARPSGDTAACIAEVVAATLVDRSARRRSGWR